MEPGQEPWLCFIPDLHEYPEGSLPSPGLLNPVRRLPPGLRLLAVGWLDGPVEFATGPTDPDVVSRLLALGSEFLINEGMRGYHECYYCRPDDRAMERALQFGDARGRGRSPWELRPHSSSSKGHHLVQLGEVVYMCPALLPHYVIKHAYRPPEEFQDAVRRGTFVADGDLIHTGEDFLEVALQASLAAAEKNGDVARADEYRRRIDGRRKELRRAGKTSGSRDPDTGVWRDVRDRVPPSQRPTYSPFSRVLIDQPDFATPDGGGNRLLRWLRARWRD